MGLQGYNPSELVEILTPYFCQRGARGCYPKRATMWHDESTVIAGNGLINSLNASQVYVTRSYQNTAANGDSFTNGCYLAAGTYTFYVLGTTNTNTGIVDWYLDDVEIVTAQDWYSGASVANVIKSQASVSVSMDGWHTVKAIVDGKNGSSSDYYIVLTKFWFKQAAD